MCQVARAYETKDFSAGILANGETIPLALNRIKRRRRGFIIAWGGAEGAALGMGNKDTPSAESRLDNSAPRFVETGLQPVRLFFAIPRAAPSAPP